MVLLMLIMGLKVSCELAEFLLQIKLKVGGSGAQDGRGVTIK